MKKFLLFFILLPFGMLSFAQIQLENGGFEQWEDAGVGANEPVDWSSIKTSDVSNLNDLAPIVCKDTSDAHTGNHSVKLWNVQTILVATGTLTNGRVHSDLSQSNQYIFTDPNDSRYNCIILNRPDSIAGWFKYFPENMDTIQVRALLHRGYAKVPDDDSINYVGMAFIKIGKATQNHWTRFSTPFVYFNDEYPQYALVILNSGNGYISQPNSVALFDDIELIYNTPPSAIRQNSQQNAYLYLDNYNQLSLKGMPLTTYKNMRILDITGRQVYTCPITSNQIDLSGLNLIRGVYLVALKNNQGIFVQKLMIK